MNTGSPGEGGSPDGEPPAEGTEAQSAYPRYTQPPHSDGFDYSPLSPAGEIKGLSALGGSGAEHGESSDRVALVVGLVVLAMLVGFVLYGFLG